MWAQAPVSGGRAAGGGPRVAGAPAGPRARDYFLISFAWEVTARQVPSLCRTNLSVHSYSPL